MKKSIIISIVVVIFIISFTLINKDDTNELIKTDLRLRWVNQSQFAGIYVAQKLYFKENGLSVQINPGGPGINFMQVVATGAEEFGIGGAAQIVEARDKGLPVVAIATIFQNNPNIFFAKRKSNIRTPKDWVGKKVAIYYGYDIENIYYSILDKFNIDRKSVVEYPATIDMGVFYRDEVDVWAGYKLNQPIKAIEDGYDIVLFDPDEYNISVPGDVLFTTESVIKQKPELVQMVVNSVLMGWNVALKDTAKAVEIVLEYDKSLDRQHEKSMMREVVKLISPSDTQIGWTTWDQWQRIIKLWKDLGAINEDIDPNDCFNDTFVKKYYSKN